MRSKLYIVLLSIVLTNYSLVYAEMYDPTAPPADMSIISSTPVTSNKNIQQAQVTMIIYTKKGARSCVMDGISYQEGDHIDQWIIFHILENRIILHDKADKEVILYLAKGF